MAGQALLKIVCLLMRWLLSLAVLAARGYWAKSAELLVLRHENAVLRRNAGRIWYDPGDRAWFAALTRFIPRGAGRRSSRSRPRRCRPGADGAPPENTTRPSGARPAARRRSAASPGWSSARRTRTCCRGYRRVHAS
jgi:hypothetical protein